MCKEGYYWHPRDTSGTKYGTCKECHDGMICMTTEMVLTSLMIEEGYYRFGNWSTDIYPCNNKNCLGGNYGQLHARGNEDGETEDAQCREGSMGPLCDLCMPKYDRDRCHRHRY